MNAHARKLTIATLAASLAACGGLPEIPEPTEGCQVRAGVATPEGAISGPFSTNIAAAGAAATIVGTCPDGFRTFARGENGSLVCYGELEWCEKARDSAPVEVTPAQLRELVRDAGDFETPPPATVP